MFDLKNKQILVIGLGGRGRAACGLLRRSGANVVVVDSANTPELREAAGQLRSEGVQIELGVSTLPKREFNFAVVSPAVAARAPLFQKASELHIPVIGELELGFQQSQCLSIAIAGTNGKGTTAELVERMLVNHHRKVVLTGHGARPICSVADQTRELDFLVLQVNAFQLETTQLFRPAVAVLLNLAPDFLDRYASKKEYVLANARLFHNQQTFDRAIVQSEALAQLQAAGVPPPSKVITFSATDPNADLYLDRGLIISRVENWAGPLLDTDQCRLHGPHNAENLMAALAVGRALRLPLETVVDSLKSQAPGPHRFELVAEAGGVRFINDSKATNVDALRSAILTASSGAQGSANVCLIAGGRDKGLDFHEVGPLISKHVKGAFLIGEAREKIRAAWSLFTPCTLADSLLEAVTEAVKIASPGDVVLLSPACSSFDQFQNYQERGQKFSQIVNQLVGVGQHGTTT
jgi:UDP-N-acetylmuramoylalanine--D-glutamate ligase